MAGNTQQGVRRFRVGGSGFTVFRWRGSPVAFARQVANTSPAAVGPGPTPIHPLDAPHPEEIITAAATSMGQLQLELYELYGRKSWDDLAGLAGSHDLQEILLRVANTPDAIAMTKFVFPPEGSRVGNYSETYHNCVITNVLDGETIEVGTMEVLKQIVVGYTHSRRSDHQDAAPSGPTNIR
jgi:hypothetical protein